MIYMELWQREIILAVIVYSIGCFLAGVYYSRKKKYTENCYLFYPLGAFVWADVVIFGLFFGVSTAVILYLNNWNLFLVFYSIFWTIRSFGESVYWFNQQFSTVNRNPGKNQWPYFFFKDEYTVWFVYQIMWQCVCVVSTILAIYFTYQWLKLF
ncbi:MAG: hypothetical protein HY376_01205 [Candidatus Blackburnbacteria bacterium]|nr:hypothetical protein [Candidatus Blackburnbacteria bacterium]